MCARTALNPLLAATALLLSGCARHPAPPTDDAMEVAISAGRQAVDNHLPDEAVPRFEDAYRRALLRDDAEAIGDVGYDLATAQLMAGEPPTALATLARTRRDLLPRGIRTRPDLDLVAAAGLDRLGRFHDASLAAARAATAKDPDTAARAAYLSGLIADHAGDGAAVITAARRLDALAPTGSRRAALPLWRRADLSELAARAALASDVGHIALQEALTTVDLRRTALDYAGLRTALDLAARASDRLGDPGAAAAYRRRIEDSRAANAPPKPGSDK